MNSRIFWALASAYCLGAGANVAQAADWSQTYIGASYGPGYREAGNPEKIGKVVLSASHFNGDKYGTNYLYGDLLQSDNKDPALNGGGGATEFYGIYQRSVSFSALSGNKSGYGIAKDLSAIVRFDLGTKNDAFASRSRKLRLGLSASMPVNTGFWEISLAAYKETNHNGYVGKSVNYHVAPSLATAWSVQYGALGSFNGFMNVIGPKGKDGFGNESVTEILLRTNFLFDVGKTGFKIGPGLEWSEHKYGVSSAQVGVNQLTALLVTEYHF